MKPLFYPSFLYSIRQIRFVVSTLVFIAVGCNILNPSVSQAAARPEGKIVFTTSDFWTAGEIYIMNADGSHPTRLTFNDADDTEPVWSPDGTQIAFVSDRDGNDEIYVMGNDGSDPIRLTNSSESDYNPKWSPDGTKIAFYSNRNGASGLYLMGTDGSNQVRINVDTERSHGFDWSPDGTQIAFAQVGHIRIMSLDGTISSSFSAGSHILSLAWSPDGSRFAYSRYGYHVQDIYTLRLDNGEVTRFVASPIPEDEAAWSPDGITMLFEGARTDLPGFYTINADGTEERHWTVEGVAPHSMDWHPDQDPNLPPPDKPAYPPVDPLWEIATTSWRDGNYEIYVMRGDTSHQTNVTNNKARDYGAVWSPNGQRIAFTSDRDGNNEIYTMDPNGENLVRVTNHSASDSHPAWSPNGERIAFTSERDGNAEIYTINADGSDLRRVTRNAAEDSGPSWSPDGAYITFASTRDGNGEIYTKSATGATTTRITYTSLDEEFPKWSPDGTQILYMVSELPDTGYPGIFTMSTDGLNQELWAADQGYEIAQIPSWAPDSKGFAYTLGHTGPWDNRFGDKLAFKHIKDEPSAYDLNPRFSQSFEHTIDLKDLMLSDNAPTAVDDYFYLPPNGTARAAAPGVLFNDINPISTQASVTLSSEPSLGTVSLNADGSFVYTLNDPDSDPYSYWRDSFSYIANNGGESNVGYVYLRRPRSNQSQIGLVHRIEDGQSPPTIDGQRDNDPWYHSRLSLDNSVLTYTPNRNSLQAYWSGLYDDDNLYLFVTVVDDDLQNDSDIEFWLDDVVDIYIDGNHSQEETYDDVDDLHLLFRWNDPANHIGYPSIPAPAGIQRAEAKTEDGYSMEIAIPLADLNIEPIANTEFGIDIHVIDDDNGGDREHKLTWNSKVDETYINPSLMGTARLYSRYAPQPTPTPTTTVLPPTPTPIATAVPENNQSEIKQSHIPPTIDGSVDGLWQAAATYPIDNLLLGSAPSSPDLSATWQALYDSENLYLLVDVTDDDLRNDSGTQFWLDDVVDIYIDGNNSRQTTYDADDLHLLFRWGDTVAYPGYPSAPVPLNLKWAALQTETGYRVEIALPLSEINITPNDGYEFGIDVHVIDDDASNNDGGDRDHKLAWNSVVDETYVNPSLMGQARLLAVAATATPTVPPPAPTFTPTPTPVSPTAVPPTAVPPTTVPPTTVPPTAVPPTTVPPTSVATATPMQPTATVMPSLTATLIPPTTVPPTGVPPTSVSPTASPTDAPPNGSESLEQEAEAGVLFGDFAIGVDSAASNGRYVHVPEGSGNSGSELPVDHKVRYTVNINEEGTYRIKAWTYAPDIFNNSFYIQVDEEPQVGTIWHTQVNTGYAGEYVTNGNGADILKLYLTTGQHTIDVFLREDGTRLDKLALELTTDEPAPPTAEGCAGLVREGEGAELSGHFLVRSDGNASNGWYVNVPQGFGNRGVALDPQQKASYCFTVAEAGTYRIKGWVQAKDAFNNSFYVQVDGAPAQGYLWHNQISGNFTDQYVTDQNGLDIVELELSAGEHIVDIFLREDGTFLDKLALERIDASSANNAVTAAAAESTSSNWLFGTISLDDPKLSWLRNDTASLSDAELILTDVETNGAQYSQSTSIDHDGGYYFDQVPVGRYQIGVILPDSYGAVGSSFTTVEMGADEVVEKPFNVDAVKPEGQNQQSLFLPLIQ